MQFQPGKAKICNFMFEIPYSILSTSSFLESRGSKEDDISDISSSSLELFEGFRSPGDDIKEVLEDDVNGTEFAKEIFVIYFKLSQVPHQTNKTYKLLDFETSTSVLSSISLLVSFRPFFWIPGNPQTTFSLPENFLNCPIII